MELLEGIRTLQGCPASIPDCSREDLPKLFKQLGFKVGVEIGVFRGMFTEILAKSGLRIYGVDPWRVYKNYGNLKDQKRYEKLYEEAMRRVAPYPNVTIIRKTSMEAVDDFKDGSIDFVYIDGNHRFRYIAEDIYEWAFKVKDGGIICGHDYAPFKRRYLNCGCQVKEIIDAFVESYDIENFWALCRRRGGEPRDSFRSWLIIKDNRWVKLRE